MNKLIKYAIVGTVGYVVGQMSIKYRIMRKVVKATLEKEKERKEEVEAQ